VERVTVWVTLYQKMYSVKTVLQALSFKESPAGYRFLLNFSLLYGKR